MLQITTKKVAAWQLSFHKKQRLIHLSILGATAVLLLFLIPGVFAATGKLALGERLEVNCNGEHIEINPASKANIAVHCRPGVVGQPIDPPEPLPTATPINPPPTPTPTQQPEPTPTTPPQSSFGLYPDCIAPAIGIEAQSWWQPTDEAAPRQVKMGTCLPNARSAEGGDVIVSGELDASVRITAVNNPAIVEWLRYQWQRDTQDIQRIDQQCQPETGEFKSCTWHIPVNIDTAKRQVSGMDEVKLTTNTRHGDLNDRQFPTIGFQLHHGGSENFRSSPAPLVSSWYSGLRYANAHWRNYIDLLQSAQETIPTVSGVLTLDVAHSVSKETCHRSAGFVDPHFDAFFAGQASEPIPFYQITGCHEGAIELDTSQLSNGVHTIQLLTAVSIPDGIHTAVAVYQINVQN
ncbi:MAG: hypothetical protein AAF614_24780 [Chloroflexota bacterium]